MMMIMIQMRFASKVFMILLMMYFVTNHKRNQKKARKAIVIKTGSTGLVLRSHSIFSDVKV